MDSPLEMPYFYWSKAAQSGARHSRGGTMRTHTTQFSLLATSLLIGVISSAPAKADWPTNGVGLCPAAPMQAAPSSASDGAGGSIIVWTDFTDGSTAVIYAYHLTRGGVVDNVWPACGTAVGYGTSSRHNSRCVSDGAGGALIAWEDARSSGTTGLDIYASRITNLGAVASGWTAGGVAVCTATGTQQFAQQRFAAIADDGGGGCFITWDDQRESGIDHDIYLQHLTASGSVASGWPTDGLGVCMASANQTAPSVISDGSGGAIVVWQDERDVATTNSDIYAIRVTGAGAIVSGWSTDGTGVCTTSPEQKEPALIPDGAGGAIFVWQNGTGLAQDIYALRLTAAGALASGWSSGGAVLCSATRDQFFPVGVTDGAGGAIVAWHDARGSNHDIYAQRITSAGAVSSGWPADGLALCLASFDQVFPQIASDGAGGGIVTWYDGRANPNYDIFAQRVTAAGSIPSGWPSDGTGLCTASDDQLFPTIVADDIGGAIVAWQDARNLGTNSQDIFAQRVTAAGTAGGTVGVPHTLSNTLQFRAAPNPAHGPTTIHLETKADGPVAISVYDAEGRLVRMLEHAARMPAGQHEFHWDGADALGRRVSPGVYSVHVRAGSQSMTKQIALLP